MKKNKYPLMGRLMTTTFIYKRCVNDQGLVTWETEEIDPRSGWVTRYSHLLEGRIRSGGGYGPDYEPPIFHPTKTIPCVMLTFWPTLKPVPVPLTHLTEGGIPHPPKQPPMSEQQKQMLREDIKNQPRKNGKFVKI